MAQNNPQTLLWHTLMPEQVLSALNVDHAGLSTAESRSRLAQTGPNALPEGLRKSLAQMFGGQFTDFMIIVLLAAAVISGVLGELIDTLVILVIVALNAVIGTVQEYRAEKAMAALKALAGFQARVLRDGQVQAVASVDLVPGDIVLVEAGDVVPADLRLLEAAQLQVDEAALTGESRVVDKVIDSLDELVLPLGDQVNMAFKGTLITHGRARGVVVATGIGTELGKIAQMIETAEDTQTPLQSRLMRFGKRLALAVLAICAILFVTGLLRGEPVMLMFLTAVSLAVAAIPEALPAVVSMALAMGARRMSTEKALIRHLPAVETLGSVTFICADKTGTLTQNKMHAEAIVCGGARLAALPGSHAADDAWRHLAQAMALNNDVRPSDQGQMMGDPTEVALLMAAAEAAYDKAGLEQQLPRQYELPFDSVRKRMTTIHRDGDHYLAYVKGAPEEVLAECSTAMGIEFDHEAILAQAEALAAEGYRVLAYACRTLAEVPRLTPEHIESQLSFLGLVALIDPPRPEVPAAIIDCKTAGITPVMITGDHPATARVIAQRLGLIDHNDAVMTGVELARISDEELRDKISHIRIFARVSPEQKIRIVNALQERGEFVAMTGDGVNDAPALKKSDIGVAMGMKGTDVAREASDMVLLDDNFATIVAAVREGRRIFDNIRKFIKYGMTSNSGEVWTLFLAPFFGLPIPLLPVHILWINLVTDGLPGLALAVEPEEKGIMQRPPRPPNESIFAHGMWQHIIWIGLLIGGLSIVTQAYALHNESPNWQTMVFTTLTFSQLVHAFVIRSEQRSIFSLGLISNLPLLGAVILTVGLQLLVIYHPWANAIFNTQPLALAELGFCVAISFVILIAVELEKWFARQGWIYSADSLA